MASLCTWSCGSFVSPSSNFLEDDKGGGMVGLELMAVVSCSISLH